jgi:hypothetical protein
MPYVHRLKSRRSIIVDWELGGYFILSEDTNRAGVFS